MSHINSPKLEPIRLHIDISAEDARQLQLIQAEYLALRQHMDLPTIVTAIVHEAIVTRLLAQRTNELIARHTAKEAPRDYHL